MFTRADRLRAKLAWLDEMAAQLPEVAPGGESSASPLADLLTQQLQGDQPPTKITALPQERQGEGSASAVPPRLLHTAPAGTGGLNGLF